MTKSNDCTPQFCSLFDDSFTQEIKESPECSKPKAVSSVDYEKRKAEWEQHEQELLSGTPEDLVAKYQTIRRKKGNPTYMELDDCNEIVKRLFELQNKIYYKAVEAGCTDMGCKDRSILDDADRLNLIFEGIRKGLKTFDPQKASKNSFSTYTYVCVRNETKTHLKKIYTKNGWETSLDASINPNGDGKEMTVYDKVGSSAYSADNVTVTKDMELLCHKLFAKYLDPQSEYIVIMSFGLFGEPAKTESEIGDIMHLSQASVSKRLGDSVAQLKAMVTAEEHEMLKLILMHKTYDAVIPDFIQK